MTAQLSWHVVIMTSSNKYFSYKNKINFYKIGLWAHKLFVKWISGAKAPQNKVGQQYSDMYDLVYLRVDHSLILINECTPDKLLTAWVFYVHLWLSVDQSA